MGLRGVLHVTPNTTPERSQTEKVYPPRFAETTACRRINLFWRTSVCLRGKFFAFPEPKRKKCLQCNSILRILSRIDYSHKPYAPTKGTRSMIQLFDAQAPKKPSNLSINSDLLVKARELNINL